MKKVNFSAFDAFKLIREELKYITGSFGACTASCGGGVVVTCTGDNCNANDNSGCSSTNETKACPKPSGGYK